MNDPLNKKICDPNLCDCCQYIGEGDFLCDKYLEIVVEDWVPNENYRMCTGTKKSIKKKLRCKKRKKSTNG